MTTLVFIPGLLLTQNLFDHQINALSGRMPIHHAKTLGMNSITLMAEDVLDNTNGKILPIGLSMGGYITLEIARLAPDRLAGMVIMDSAAIADSQERKEQRNALIKLSKMGKFKGVTKQLLPNLIAPQHLQNEELTSAIMGMAQEVGQVNFTHQQTAIMGRRDQFDTLSKLNRINIPSLFLVGEKDTLTPPQVVQDMAEATANSDYVKCPDAGHLPTMENPEFVTKTLIDFMDKNGF